ncbi:hypothetical protein [Sporosarcina sp. FA9]|uniref:hypothetical protein n=1 Tax=Sporosarcina sp. FA9 TaxID=3413030 RepID=UPI003F65C696
MEDLIKQFMEQMDKRFDQMDKRFDKVEHDIRELREEVGHNQTENRSHFKHLESKLEQQQSTFQVVADEIKGVKIDTMYLSGKMGGHETIINNLRQRIQS